MGGCLDKPKNKRSKIIHPNKPIQPPKLQASRIRIPEEINPQQDKQKYKKMTINQLLNTYSILETISFASKVEGPKYLSNLIDGSSKVLRVANLAQIDEKRLEVYKRVLDLDIYENEQGGLMILEEYCAGSFIEQLISLEQIDEFCQKIYAIILKFHENNIWCGNLNLWSFRRVSAFGKQVKLVDLNLSGHTTDLEKMGLAHKQSFAADYEFMAFLIQLLVSRQPPIFITHKMQYVEFQSIPYYKFIQSFLRGEKLKESDLFDIKSKGINQQILLGYKFRRDLNKLLKMRRKRKAHNRKLYGADVDNIIGDRFQQDVIYRFEAERILSRIEEYIQLLVGACEQSFMCYGNYEALRKLKQVFLLEGKQRKMRELRECMATIK